MVDGRLRRACGFLLVAALLTLFGLIHSVDPRGGIYLPWDLEGLARIISWQFAGAYVALAMLLGLCCCRKQPGRRWAVGLVLGRGRRGMAGGYGFFPPPVVLQSRACARLL